MTIWIMKRSYIELGCRTPGIPEHCHRAQTVEQQAISSSWEQQNIPFPTGEQETAFCTPENGNIILFQKKQPNVKITSAKLHL